jgi:transposase
VIATALVASIGDGRQFKNGRELAAWIGLVPRQRSSGGKIRLVGIGKRAHRSVGATYHSITFPSLASVT